MREYEKGQALSSFGLRFLGEVKRRKLVTAINNAVTRKRCLFSNSFQAYTLYIGVLDL